MKWDLQTWTANPPYPGRIPAIIGYLRIYATEVAYIQRRGTNDNERAYKQRIYIIEDDGQNEQHKPGNEDQKAMAAGGLGDDMGEFTVCTSTWHSHRNVV